MVSRFSFRFRDTSRTKRSTSRFSFRFRDTSHAKRSKYRGPLLFLSCFSWQKSSKRFENVRFEWDVPFFSDLLCGTAVPHNIVYVYIKWRLCGTAVPHKMSMFALFACFIMWNGRST